eukprot:Gb_28640 [translate_table: standard]
MIAIFFFEATFLVVSVNLLSSTPSCLNLGAPKIKSNTASAVIPSHLVISTLSNNWHLWTIKATTISVNPLQRHNLKLDKLLQEASIAPSSLSGKWSLSDRSNLFRHLRF